MIYQRIIKATLMLLLCTFSTAVDGQHDPEQLEELAVRASVTKLSPSVIRFETIGGNNRVDGVVVASGPSTGLVVSKDGYVISSSFHFAHQPASILARLPNGKTAAAEIVGRDLSRKVVLLKIQTELELSVPDMMKPEKVQVGQTVIAIGRALDAKSPNVSTGIISAKTRVWNKAIQTDAKISPANFGGPLTDLRGKVVGILVPMSPDDDGEMAGTQWYDSGIGFAVPILDLLERLEKLKSGTPLRAGLLGISLKGSDLYVDKAIVAFCHGTSPAGKAGILADDEIIEIDGQKITRQSELKQAIGPLYEGDEAKLIVSREGKRLPFTVRLAGEIKPYDPPGIGVTLSEELIVVGVLENSTAAEAGVQAGDKIEAFDEIQVESSQDGLNKFRSKLAAMELSSEIALTVRRDEDKKDLKLKLERRSAGFFPSTSPPQKRTAEIFEIKVADVANKCFALVPERLNGEPPPALLVWISRPGKLSKEDLEKAWLEHCQQHNVAILLPESSDEKRWSPDDADFIVNAMENLAKQSHFDSSQVTVGGIKTGGTMASLVAFGRRDLFKGLVLLDSKSSTRIARPETSPVEPLLILFGADKVEPLIEDDIQRFTELNFPVHFEQKKGGIAEWMKIVLPWVKTVNRF